MALPILAAIALSIALITPAAAQDVGGAWKVSKGRVSLRIAKISVPDRAGLATLTKTGEFSNKGKALDNFAQFESPDGKVFATVYIYRTTYADAALAAYATDRAIMSRFGASTNLAEQTVVPFAGRSGGAIRQVFLGATLNGETLATTGAFARVGSWLVKLRASGPADRTAEVTAALDALIAGAVVEQNGFIYPVAPLRIAAPCPAKDGPVPQLMPPDKASPANLLEGLLSGSLNTPNKNNGTDGMAVFPQNGQIAACVRGVINLKDRTVELLQPADAELPAVALAAIDDAGTVMTVEKAVLGEGFTIKRYTVGRVQVAGTVDRQPTAAQFSTWLTTRGAPEMAVGSEITVTAAGDTTVSINSDVRK